MDSVNKIFGLRETPKGELKRPDNQNSYQIEDFHKANVVWTKEFYADKLFLGTKLSYQVGNIFGVNPQICLFESTTEFLRVGVGETAGTVVIGWDDGDSLRLGVYSSPTDTTITSHLTIAAAGDVDVVNALTANSFASDTSISATTNISTSSSGKIFSATQNIQLAGGAANFSVGSNCINLTGDVGGNNISIIANGNDGMLLTIRFTDNLVTILNVVGVINLQGGINLASAANLILQLVYTNGQWYEVSRCQT